MTIHVGKDIGLSGQVAIDALRAEQELKPACNRRLMIAAQMCVARAKESQQGQTGDAGVGLGAGTTAILAVRVVFATRFQLAGVPSARRGFDSRPTISARRDGCFRVGRSALQLSHASPIGRRRSLYMAGNSWSLPPAPPCPASVESPLPVALGSDARLFGVSRAH